MKGSKTRVKEGILPESLPAEGRGSKTRELGEAQLSRVKEGILPESLPAEGRGSKTRELGEAQLSE